MHETLNGGVMGKKKPRKQTKAGIGILCFNSFSPVLTEEHVCRKSSLWSLWVPFGFTLWCFFSLVGGFALYDKISLCGDNKRKR